MSDSATENKVIQIDSEALWEKWRNCHRQIKCITGTCIAPHCCPPSLKSLSGDICLTFAKVSKS